MSHQRLGKPGSAAAFGAERRSARTHVAEVEPDGCTARGCGGGHTDSVAAAAIGRSTAADESSAHFDAARSQGDNGRQYSGRLSEGARSWPARGRHRHNGIGNALLAPFRDSVQPDFLQYPTSPAT